MKVSKEVVRKNALADLAVRLEHLENLALNLRGENVVLNRIADALPKDRDAQRSPIAKLISASAEKVNGFSRDINSQVTDARRTLASLKGAL